MDSSACSSSPPQGTRSYRRPSLPAAAASSSSSSKPRKPLASAGSRHPPKIHPSASKQLVSPALKHREKRAENDNLQFRLNGEDAQQYVQYSEDQEMKKEMMLALKVEASYDTGEANCVEDEMVMEESHARAKDEIHADEDATKSRQVIPDNEVLIEGKVDITASSKKEASEKGGDNIHASPHTENEQKDSSQANECQVYACAGSEENRKEGCAEFSSTSESYVRPDQLSTPDEVKLASDQKCSEVEGQIVLPESVHTIASESFKQLAAAPAQRDPTNSPLTETKTAICSEQSSPRSSESLKNEGGHDVQQSENGLLFTSEHLDSEQEGFLFAKVPASHQMHAQGDALVRETVQTSESLPAGVDTSTTEQFMEQELASLSQFEATLIAASDFKATASASRDVGNASSMPSPELMEAAVAALAKADLFAGKLSTRAKDHNKTPYMARPKLSIRFLILSMVICLLGGLFCSVLTLIQDDQELYLHPT